MATPHSESDEYKKRVFGCKITAAIAFFVLLIFAVPWVPDQFTYDVDSSWVFVLHRAFVENFAFGSDIVWHYGPLGFLFAKFYHPDTFTWLLLGWGIFSSVFWIALYHVVINSSRSPDPLIIIVLAILAAMGMETMFLLLPVLLFLHIISDKKTPSKWLTSLLILALAAASMVKISYMLFAFCTIFILDIYAVKVLQRKPFMLLSWGIATIVIWLLLGQQLSDFLPFIYGAMAQAHGSPFLMIFFLILSLFLIIFLGRAWWQDKGRKAGLSIIIICFMCFVFFKIGFVNNNGHHMLEALAMLFALLLLTRDYFWQQTPKVAQNFLAIICVISVIWYSFEGLSDPANNQENKKYSESLKSVLSLNSENSSQISDKSPATSIFDIFANAHNKYVNNMEEIRARNMLPEVTGSVDIFSSHQIALPEHADYKPRPVFQSYHAYKPYLVQKNLSYIKGESAPDNLFFSIDIIQNRFPTLDDGALWPEIIRNYDIDGIYGNYLHMKKRDYERSLGVVRIAEEITTIGASSRVPALSDDGVIWAEMNIEPTFLGRIVSLLFRLPQLSIEYKSFSGYSDKRRIVPAIMSEGFVLSPVINNILQFTLLMGGEHPTLSPIGIKEYYILPESSPLWLVKLFYKDNIKVDFFRMRFKKQDLYEIPQWNKEMETITRLTTYPFHSIISTPDNLTDQHLAIKRSRGQGIIAINGESRLFFPLSGLETSVDLSYGTYDARSLKKPLGDGVYFSIVGVEDDTEVRRTLWSKFINSPVGGKSVNKKLHLPLPNSIKGLIFNTKPMSPEKSNRSFWSDVVIE